jgi:hypothetical protein
MRLTYQDKPGNTKDAPPSRNIQKFMLFVDHKTRIVYPSSQESKTASEACRSKCDYENFARCHKVTIESYHADNGAFRTETLKKDIENKKQQLNFSGVNAQWQNGRKTMCRSTINAKSRNLEMGQNHNS